MKDVTEYCQPAFAYANVRGIEFLVCVKKTVCGGSRLAIKWSGERRLEGKKRNLTVISLFPSAAAKLLPLLD